MQTARKAVGESVSTFYGDCETRWNKNINDVGTDACCADAHAGVNCYAWAVDDGEIDVVDYYGCLDIQNGTVKPGTKAAKMLEDFERCDEVVFHKADFEYTVMTVIWHLSFEGKRIIDTMAMCRYFGHPGALDDAAQALKCSKLKDLGGKQVMLKLVRPIYTPEDCPDDFRRLGTYCGNDVFVMREIHHKLPKLPPEIYENYTVDFEINRIGVPLDMRMVNNAAALKPAIQAEANAELSRITAGVIKTVGQTDEIVKWMNARNVKMENCQADTVTAILARPDLLPTERRVLELRQAAGLASVSKYVAMQDYQVDGRLHQMFEWCGAFTMRPTGGGPQMANLARGEDSEFWADVIADQPWFLNQLDKPLEKVKEAIRGSVCAKPGKHLVWIDLQQIEARSTFWVAGEPGLKLFELSDPYCTWGSTLFGYQLNKKDHPVQRQGSKAGMLASGFGGAIGAIQRSGKKSGVDFAAMANVILPTATHAEKMEASRNYHGTYLKGMPLEPLNEREGMACHIIIQRFRRDFARIPAYWKELEDATVNGGWAGRVHVAIEGDTRVTTLPSGYHRLYYRDFKVGARGYSYESRRGMTKNIWYGTLIENVAQAINADVSNWYKERAHKQIAPVVHHCYDEFTMECDENKVDEVIAQLKELTQTKPEWCDGLPLGFDIQHGRRYGK